jgi:hypothetical protein
MVTTGSHTSGASVLAEADVAESAELVEPSVSVGVAVEPAPELWVLTGSPVDSPVDASATGAEGPHAHDTSAATRLAAPTLPMVGSSLPSHP